MHKTLSLKIILCIQVSTESKETRDTLSTIIENKRQLKCCKIGCYKNSQEAADCFRFEALHTIWRALSTVGGIWTCRDDSLQTLTVASLLLVNSYALIWINTFSPDNLFLHGWLMPQVFLVWDMHSKESSWRYERQRLVNALSRFPSLLASRKILTSSDRKDRK